ncbi:two-component system osmolarity sensor histidine kinase EnvZ [Sulfitobacter geojensis]|nr:two-component system osmolarity sensor histidine kinase EnvZ [Sulfitobacter geojensis]
MAKLYLMSFLWLKHYMPRGIYGRAALILLLPVVIIQLVVTVLFAQRHFEGVTHQMTDTVLRELALVLEVVEDAPNRAGVPAAVAAQLGALAIDVTPVEKADLPAGNRMRWYDYSGRVSARRLADHLAGFQALDLNNSNLVRVFVQTEKGPLEISFDRRRISASNPHQLFVYTIFFGFLMTFIAFVYLRNQLRPIKRLAQVAESFGRGRHEPYSPSGAVEVRSAGNAFIDMRNRIERHIEQRTLMLSGVSHDLRTPLTRMRLSLSMLEDDEADPLMQDVDDMQRMLDEFLNFAKGAAEGTPEDVTPYDLVNEIVTEAQRGGRDVVLLDREGDGRGTVKLRVVAIRRAIDNLISNAVRYGARAEVSVMLTDKTLRFRVEDDGPGIPEDRRAEATRAFTRLDPSRNQDLGGGVGLGLAIATDIARAHGGVLRLGESRRMGGLRADIVIAR